MIGHRLSLFVTNITGAAVRQLRLKFWVGGACLAALAACGGGNGTGEMPPSGIPPVILPVATTSAYPENAPLSVQMPPPGKGPLLVTISKGQALTMTVTATGDEPMGYVWRFNGNRIEDAPDRAQYTIRNMQPDTHSGVYYVSVYNRVGATGSAVVNVTVKEP